MGFALVKDFFSHKNGFAARKTTHTTTTTEAIHFDKIKMTCIVQLTR